MAAPNLGQLVATTISNYERQLTDQIFKGRRTMAFLAKKGAKDTYEGGDRIVIPIEYAKNTNVKWQGEYDNYSLLPQNFIDAPTFNWLNLTGTIIHTNKEKVTNSGKHAMIRLAKAKIDNLTHSLETEANVVLFSDGSDVLKPAGFRAAFAATGTYGGISKTTHSFWRGNVDSDAEQLNIDDMRTLWRNCEQETTAPDGIATTRTLIERYEKIVQGFQQINKTDVGDLGFENLSFKGAPIWYDDDCTALHLFMLNSKYLSLFCHPEWMFKVGEMEKSQTQPIWIQPVEWWGNFICRAPRYQGMMTAKTA